MNLHPIERLKEINEELERTRPRMMNVAFEPTDTILMEDEDTDMEVRSHIRQNEELIETYEGLTDELEKASFLALEIKNAISESESLL